MVDPDREREQAGLLRSSTFRGQERSHEPAESLITKVFGTKNAANHRVSESLDYEPVQNKIFYDRMKAAKEKRHLAAFG